MADKKFLTLITAAGAERIANAAATGTPVGISEMAVGDGGGILSMPSNGSTRLINEQYRGVLNKLVIADSNASVIEAEMIMPPQIGGFWLREMALYADDGECIAVGNMPETYKPLLAEGSGRFQIIRMQLIVSSTAAVELIADPSVVLATVEDVTASENTAKDYADEQLGEHENSRNHPDATLTAKGFTQLSNATDSDSEELAATPAAVKAAIKAAVEAAVRQAWELDNPVGSSRIFNQNLNPNQRWPWSQWEYAGEHLTIRTAKADGSDVGTIGGSDTANITRANLPTSVLNVSGSTSEQGEQKLQTTPAGRHKHPGGMGAPGEVWDDDYIVGSDNDSHRTRNYTGDAEDHAHEATVPAHSHTVWAQTEALGQGQAINIVERHKLQMLWHRVA
ncbi:phage tail protein [Serratia plymuthica]|uniref:phage tail protein n=1 Tax=Serratia plymuthica TaxID=82996 RepID=UPI002DBE2417|nr:phage tail protein [Serratia plymuthica]MEB6540303.1 phage tail protein [Serratia plymuthica]